MDLLDSLLAGSPSAPKRDLPVYVPTPKGVVSSPALRCKSHYSGDDKPSKALRGIRCKLRIDHEGTHWAKSKDQQLSEAVWTDERSIEAEPPPPEPYVLRYVEPPSTLEALLLEIPTMDQPVFLAGWYAALGAAEAVLAQRDGGSNWDYAYAYGDCVSDIEDLAGALPRPEFTKGL